MASVKYTYSINDDFLNGIVAPDSLTQEIQISTITIAIDFIGTSGDICDIWMKASLSGAEETTLEGIVAAHVGEELSETIENRAVDGKLLTQTTPRKRGTKTKYMGIDDDCCDITAIGGGSNEFKHHHSVGDAMTQVIYCDANMVPELNESWLHSSTLMCLDARNDDLTVEFEPRIVDYGLVGVNTATFTGAGLDDLTSGGTFSGGTSKDFRIKIDATGTPDTFKWSNDGGTTWGTTGVSITGSAQTLEEGVTVTFAATTGHTLDDEWRVKAVISVTSYRMMSSYLVVPYAFGAGYGPVIDIFNDVEDPCLTDEGYGALVYIPDHESPTTGEMVAPTNTFWDASFNTTTNKYENVTPNLTGTGRYNMFTYPIDIPDTRFLEKMPMLGSGVIGLGSHDIEQLGHGLRMKVTLTTQPPDHEWWCCWFIHVFRKHV